MLLAEDEYVVLQYYIGSQFTNEWLYQHLPSPEILLYVFYRDKLCCSMWDINSEVLKKYATAAFTFGRSNKSDCTTES